LRLRIEILQADDLVMLDRPMIVFLGIEVMNACGIRGIAVGDKYDFLLGCCGPDRLVHGDNSRMSIAVIRHVVGDDFEVTARDEEKDVPMLSQDLDIGFISCADGVDRAFMRQVETVAIKGSCGGIVKDRLIREVDIEDGLQDGSGFPRRDGKGDIESEDEAQDVFGVMDFRKIDSRLFGGRMHKVLGFVMILPVLIAELEL